MNSTPSPGLAAWVILPEKGCRPCPLPPRLLNAVSANLQRWFHCDGPCREDEPREWLREKAPKPTIWPASDRQCKPRVIARASHVSRQRFGPKPLQMRHTNLSVWPFAGVLGR